jgi:hypothetical protein
MTVSGVSIPKPRSISAFLGEELSVLFEQRHSTRYRAGDVQASVRVVLNIGA